MKRGILLVLLLFSIYISGCVPALIGTGIVGGIIISDDTVSETFEKDVDTVWKEAISYLEENGEIVKIDKENGIVYAEKVFGSRYVQIKVEGKPVGTKVWVKARKTAKLIPDVDDGVKVIIDLHKRLR